MKSHFAASSMLVTTHSPRALGRRQLGKVLAALGGACVAAPLRRLWAADCTLAARTPIEGPYFLGEPEEKLDTGSGLVVSGRVRDANTCAAIPGAVIVRWHANELGVYEEYYRAAMPVNADGAFEMTTITPGAYANLDPHVHWYVVADGYQPLIAQLQWRKGTPIGPLSTFDFALVPKPR